MGVVEGPLRRYPRSGPGPPLGPFVCSEARPCGRGLRRCPSGGARRSSPAAALGARQREAEGPCGRGAEPPGSAQGWGRDEAQ